MPLFDSLVLMIFVLGLVFVVKYFAGMKWRECKMDVQTNCIGNDKPQATTLAHPED